MCMARAGLACIRTARIRGVGSPRVPIGWQGANRMTSALGGAMVTAGLTFGVCSAPAILSVTQVYRRTRDLFLAQRFARHVSPLTTTIYTHPSDDEMASRLRRLTC